jgi:Flp pilus assembly protein TadB
MAIDKVANDKVKTSQDLLESALALLMIVLVVAGLFYVILFILAVIVLFAIIFLKYRKRLKSKRRANKAK